MTIEEEIKDYLATELLRGYCLPGYLWWLDYRLVGVEVARVPIEQGYMISLAFSKTHYLREEHRRDWFPSRITKIICDTKVRDSSIWMPIVDEYVAEILMYEGLMTKVQF